MKEKRKTAWLAVLLAVTAALSGCAGEAVLPEELPETTEEAPEPVTALRAQDDFYGYVNLAKLDTLEIGYGKESAGSFDETDSAVQAQLDAIINDIVSSSEDYPDGSSEQLIRDFYNQYLEYEKPGEYSERVFAEVFARIDAVSTVSEYAELMGEFYREYNIPLLISPVVQMNYFEPSEYGCALVGIDNALGLSGLKELTEDKSAAFSIKEALQSLLTARGIAPTEAEERAVSVVNLLMDIASATDFEVYEAVFPMSYLSRHTLSELDEIFTGIDLVSYLKDCGAQTISEEWYISDRGQLEAINAVLCSEKLRALKDYAAASFVMNYGEFMPEEYSGFRSRYFGTGAANRSKLALETVKQSLWAELGEVYAERCGSAETIAAAEKMCEDMRTAYFDLIRGADWLSEETRRLLCEKLENMEFLIGAEAPVEPDPLDKELIGSEILETRINMDKRIAADSIANIGKPYPKSSRGMPPQIVNACYNTNNVLEIPLGIINTPFFDSGRSEAANLGALGMVIAHEMSHAFDSDCIAFDAEGRYNPEWLPEADRLAFEEKMRQTEEYYSRFTIMDVYHVDGELTLGENFADLGAMQCIMSVVNTPEEKRELLESYANIWCSLEQDVSALQGLRMDVHSPAVVRVNAVVSSCDDFYELYDVREGDGMYIAPEDRVSRW